MGERGLRLATGEATLARLAQLDALNLEEVDDIIPADDSILLILKPGRTPSEALVAALAEPVHERPAEAGALHVLPLVLGEAAGPDLAYCAAVLGLDVPAFSEALLGLELRVAFLGFQPGFPYLTGLPPTWTLPRRSTPRVRVAAGSVALGAGYAGIYPAAGPGGWHLVGQTDVRLFDPQRDPPALLAAGDRVRFERRA